MLGRQLGVSIEDIVAKTNWLFASALESQPRQASIRGRRSLDAPGDGGQKRRYRGLSLLRREPKLAAEFGHGFTLLSISQNFVQIGHR